MPRPIQDRTKINLHMQTRVLDGLRKIARVKGTTYSELIREACHQYIVREGQRLLNEQKALAAATPAPAYVLPRPPGPTEEEVFLTVDECAQRIAVDEFDPRERGV